MLGTRSAGSVVGTRGSLAAVRTKAPRLVLGLGMSGVAAAVETHFRNLGWDIARAGSGAEAGRLAHRHKATAVVLPVAAADESGFLTCAKVVTTRPHARVVLVGPEGLRYARFARQAGAVAYLPDGCGPAAITRAVLGN